jgi:hypothetical protein
MIGSNSVILDDDEYQEAIRYFDRLSQELNTLIRSGRRSWRTPEDLEVHYREHYALPLLSSYSLGKTTQEAVLACWFSFQDWWYLYQLLETNRILPVSTRFPSSQQISEFCNA